MAGPGNTETPDSLSDFEGSMNEALWGEFEQEKCAEETEENDDEVWD